ncbi:MAG: hypothetical protein LKJ22_08540 [Liquorilactobacillus nagelii]|jgi:hypothetical protein|uniref:hypothetical protein n=1 Tax=Liquorilactobacillus nagelii TaxID=82688 RepID=UPI00242EA9DF|nr:hypothetical protein [Liquorilactobacillus nagelii]MCI1921954.1 hypothetical protein [Liquorilactobacillus nagelii]MCI1976398.1 hypothetical protein [Liquorilactobacillus nagelii]
MKYKKGDRVVFKIDEIDASDLNDVKFVTFGSDQLLGKLEDFQPAEKKIKMTVEEKNEFDLLREQYITPYAAMANMHACSEPHLFKKVNTHESDEKRAQNQFKFFKAFEHPELIEVEKEKKYYVHLLENDPCGYLNYDVSAKEYFIGSKGESDNYKTKFAKPEIAKMHFDNFKFTNKALEEVEDE